MSLTISIDAMGGDHGPQVTIPASLDCLKNNPELRAEYQNRWPYIHIDEYQDTNSVQYMWRWMNLLLRL